MSEFDYARAWRELAAPAFDGLPQNIRDLYAKTIEKGGGIAQASDCSLPWPDDDGELRREFSEVPAEWLALAARVVYDFGHWKPGGVKVAIPDTVGGTWRFAHYADQSLRERLGMPERGDNGRGRGVFLQVIEGALRLCYSSRDCWMWEELDIATQEGKDRIAAAALGDVTRDTFEDRAKAYRREWLPKLGRFGELLGAGKAYRSGPEAQHEKEERLAEKWGGRFPAPYVVERVGTVVDPHPFVITQEHLAKSWGSTLDANAAPCGYPRCQLNPDEHKGTLTMFVRVPEKLTGQLPEDLHAQLRAIKDEAEGDGIGGFGFLEPGR